GWGGGQGGGIREANGGGGDSRVGNQVLDAVEREVIALTTVLHRHFQRVTAGIRLGQREGEDFVTLDRRGEIALLLLGVPPGHDRILADAGVAGEKGADARALTADAGQSAG